MYIFIYYFWHFFISVEFFRHKMRGGKCGIDNFYIVKVDENEKKQSQLVVLDTK